VWDPNQFSRGVISHGNLQIHGAATTSFVALAESPVKGNKTLVLAELPVGWDPGERIVVTGTNPNKNQDEQLEIASVSTVGGKVTVTVTTPLLHNNPLVTGQSIYVTNVSRNATVQSLSVAQTQHRGHVMIMHKPTAEIEYAGFYGLGRTDKRNPLHNVELDSAGALVPGTGKNQVGRYAVHFHRTGLDHHVAPPTIRGSAVVDSPGWGIVNHSSYVNVEGNTAFDIIGAAYVTEAGNEIGAFRNNIAIRSTGSGAGIESREDRQDFGHQGDGFWFQGAGIGRETSPPDRNIPDSSISPARSSRKGWGRLSSWPTTWWMNPGPAAKKRSKSAAFRSGCSRTMWPLHPGMDSSPGSTC
jgi:hypothetical protein